MDWFLRPESVFDKVLVMVVAILLFVVVMALILWLIDRPKVPNWVVVLGFLGPVTIAIVVGLLYPALSTTYRSFQVSSVVLGPDGKPIINRQTGQRSDRTGFSLDNYTTVFTDPGFQKVLINTALWVILVPIVATFFGLIYAVIVDRTRFEKAAKALIFLPMAISMVGASIIWKFIYEYRQAGVESDRPGQPGPGLARAGSVPVPHHRAVEHVLPDRGDDLDPGRLRDDAAVGGDQGGARTTSSRRRRSTARLGSSCSPASRCRRSGRPSWSC